MAITSTINIDISIRADQGSIKELKDQVTEALSGSVKALESSLSAKVKELNSKVDSLNKNISSRESKSSTPSTTTPTGKSTKDSSANKNLESAVKENTQKNQEVINTIKSSARTQKAIADTSNQIQKTKSSAIGAASSVGPVTVKAILDPTSVSSLSKQIQATITQAIATATTTAVSTSKAAVQAPVGPATVVKSAAPTANASVVAAQVAASKAQAKTPASATSKTLESSNKTLTSAVVNNTKATQAVAAALKGGSGKVGSTPPPGPEAALPISGPRKRLVPSPRIADLDISSALVPPGGGGGGGGPKLPVKEFSDFNNSIKAIGRSFAETTGQLAKFTAAAAVISSTLRTVRAGFDTIVNVDTSLAGLNKILATNRATLEQLRDSAVSIGVEFGQSIETVLEGFTVFAQQGLTAPEIQDRGRAVSLGANVSTLGTDELSETITALLKVFPEDLNNSAERLIDSFVAVESANAVTAADLSEVGRRVGVAAKNAGVSFDELNAITTVVQEATRSGGARIGTAFRRILLNLQTDRAETVLGQIGVQTRNIQGNFVPAFKILQDIAKVFPTLTDTQKRNVTQTVAQTRFTNQFLSLLENFPKVNKVVTQSQNSSGTAAERNENVLASLSKQAERTSSAFQGLALSLSDGLVSPLTDVLKVATSVLQTLTSISELEIPGLGAVSQGLDFVLGTGQTEDRSSGVSVGDTLGPIISSLAGVATGIIAAGLSVKTLGISFKALLPTLKSLGSFFKNLIVIGPAIAGFGSKMAMLSARATGLIGVFGGLAAFLAGRFINRSLETPQERLTRTGVTENRTSSIRNLGNLREIQGNLELSNSQIEALQQGGTTSGPELENARSSRESAVDSLRSLILNNSDRFQNAFGLNIGEDNQISFDGKSLENLEDVELEILIGALEALEKTNNKTANAITTSTKLLGSFSTTLGRFASLDFSGKNLNAIQKIVDQARTGRGTAQEREVFRSATVQRSTLQPLIGSLFEGFEREGTAGVERDILQIQRDASPEQFRQTAASLFSSSGSAQVKAVEDLLKELPQTLRNDGFGQEESRNVFEAGLQVSRQNFLKELLESLGRVDQSGTLQGTRIGTGTESSATDLTNQLSKVTGFTTGFVQALDSAGKVVNTFTIDVSKSGERVLRGVGTSPEELTQGVTEIEGNDAIVKFLQELDNTSSVIVEANSRLKQEIPLVLQTISEGFGAGVSLEGSNLKDGPKSLLDFSDTAAAAFQGIGESGALFNQRLQQVSTAIAEQQKQVTDSPDQGTRIQAQQRGIFASLVNTVGQVNKSFAGLTQRIDNINISRKIEELFSPSAIDSERAFGGRGLNIALGKFIEDLSPEERAVERFSSTFGELESLQTLKKEFATTASEVAKARNELLNILTSQNPEALQGVDANRVIELFRGSGAAFEPGKEAEVDTLIQDLFSVNTAQTSEKVREKLLSLIPEGDSFKPVVDSLNQSIKPLEVAARTAQSIERLAASADQASRSFQSQGRVEGFFENLREGIGKGLNALAGADSPNITTSRFNREDPRFLRDNRRASLSGDTNLERQQSLNRLLSSREVRQGVLKVFDEQGQQLSSITPQEAEIRNRSLRQQASRERSQNQEGLRNTRLNTFASSLTNQFTAIDDILNRGNLSPSAAAGLRSVQAEIEKVASAPATAFINRDGTLKDGATDLLSKLPDLIRNSFTSEDTKALESASTDSLRMLASAGSEQASQILKERQQESIEPLIEPTQSINQNTSKIVSIANSILNKMGLSKSTSPKDAETKSVPNFETLKTPEAQAEARKVRSFAPSGSDIKDLKTLPGNISVSLDKNKSPVFTNANTENNGIIKTFDTNNRPVFTSKGSKNNSDIKESTTSSKRIKKPSVINDFIDSITSFFKTSENSSEVASSSAAALGIAGVAGSKRNSFNILGSKPRQGPIMGINRPSVLAEGAQGPATAKRVAGKINTFTPGGLAGAGPKTFADIAKAEEIISKGFAPRPKVQGPRLGITQPSFVMENAEQAKSLVNTTKVSSPAGVLTGAPAPKAPTTFLGRAGQIGLKSLATAANLLGKVAGPLELVSNPAIANANDIIKDPREIDIARVSQKLSMAGKTGQASEIIRRLESEGIDATYDNLEKRGLVPLQENIEDLSKKQNPENIDFKRRSEQEAEDLAKAQSVETGGLRTRQQDNSVRKLDDINSQLQTQTSQAQTGIEVTNTDEITSAVRDGIENTEFTVGGNLESAISSLTGSINTLITSLTSNLQQNTVGGTLSNIEERVQSLIDQSLEPVVTETNQLRQTTESALSNLDNRVEEVRQEVSSNTENTRQTLEELIASAQGELSNQINQSEQKLQSLESNLQATNTSSQQALVLAARAQQTAESVESSLRSTQARITQASLNNSGY